MCLLVLDDCHFYYLQLILIALLCEQCVVHLYVYMYCTSVSPHTVTLLSHSHCHTPLPSHISTDRTDSNRMSSSSLNPPDVPRVVAIANTDYSTLHEDACALTFSQGDVIIVEGRRGPDVFEGSARGRCGSFLASDVSFFTGNVCMYACTCLLLR